MSRVLTNIIPPGGRVHLHGIEIVWHDDESVRTLPRSREILHHFWWGGATVEYESFRYIRQSLKMLSLFKHGQGGKTAAMCKEFIHAQPVLVILSQDKTWAVTTNTALLQVLNFQYTQAFVVYAADCDLLLLSSNPPIRFCDLHDFCLNLLKERSSEKILALSHPYLTTHNAPSEPVLKETLFMGGMK